MNWNGNGSGGWPPVDPTAAINPPTDWQRAQDPGIRWIKEQVYYPTPWMPVGKDNNIGQQFRWYAFTSVINAAANSTNLVSVQVDIPLSVYAITASATPSDGSALPNNLDPLDTFTIQFTHNTGDQLNTNPVLGSAICGTAKKPSLIGGIGWPFDRGGTPQASIVPLRAGLRIDVALWCIELRGPTNIGR